MLERITSWLSDSDDYQTGLDLLRETGYTGFTLSILATGDDAYNRSRLEQELTKWADAQKNVLPIGNDIAHGTKGNSVLESPDEKWVTISLDELRVMAGTPAPPKEVQQIESTIHQLMDERTEAKAWIRAKEDLGNGEAAQAERRPYAYRIKVITRAIDDLYSQLDFYEQYGYLAPLTVDPDVDEYALLLNKRSYVSRYKAKLKKKNLTPEQRRSYQALLDQYETEKTQLELKLSRQNDSHTTGQQTSDRPIHPNPLPPT